jgi:hypothetical protein
MGFNSAFKGLSCSGVIDTPVLYSGGSDLDLDREGKCPGFTVFPQYFREI